MRKAFYAIVLFLAAMGLHAAERSEAEIRAIAYAKLNQASAVKGLNGTNHQTFTIQRLVDEKAVRRKQIFTAGCRHRRRNTNEEKCQYSFHTRC